MFSNGCLDSPFSYLDRSSLISIVDSTRIPDAAGIVYTRHIGRLYQRMSVNIMTDLAADPLHCSMLRVYELTASYAFFAKSRHHMISIYSMGHAYGP